MDTTTSTIPSWCQPTSTTDLHPSSLQFLSSLNLPFIHPQCSSSDNFVNDDDSNYTFSDSSPLEYFITLYFQTIPALLAMAELWLRLFAFVVAPLCLFHLSYCHILDHLHIQKNSSSSSSPPPPPPPPPSIIVMILGLISSAVLCTDEMYVMEYGESYGNWLFTVIMALVVTRQLFQPQHQQHRQSRLKVIVSNLIIFTVIFSTLRKGHEPLDIPPTDKNSFIKAKFYHSSTNPFIQRLVSHIPPSSLNYDAATGGVATPWLVTGDSRTGIPFVLNHIPLPLPYHRVYLPFDNDNDNNDAIALDIAFPPSGHDEKKPVFLLLHGLNGGSSEEYIKEFVRLRCLGENEGSTVIIMIARGLMNVPVFGDDVFHGARVSDVHATASVLKRSFHHHPVGGDVVLVGVGYSMGAIILANYVSRYGAACALDAAVSISGGLDMRENASFGRSQRLWQPILTVELRNILWGKFKEKYGKRLSRGEVRSMLRATSITQIDEYAVVIYNKFRNVLHYYSEMSALGDVVSHHDDDQHNKTYSPRIQNVSIPLLILHALDDPIITWRTMGHPERVVSEGEGNVLMLITKTGGHVGWPVGLDPRWGGWSWMNDVVKHFTDAFLMAKNGEDEDEEEGR